MKTKCNLCGIQTEKDFCKVCINFLKQKYPDKKLREQILQWHKNHTKKLNKEY